MADAWRNRQVILSVNNQKVREVFLIILSPSAPWNPAMKNIFVFTIFLIYITCTCSPIKAGTAFYEYDDSGRLILCNSSQSLISYSYDEVGNIIAVSSYTTGGFVDTDHDNIDDSWELFYFTTLQVANRQTDHDKDGYTDLEEYTFWNAGTMDEDGHPFNPLFFNRGDKNPKHSILLLIVPVISAGNLSTH